MPGWDPTNLFFSSGAAFYLAPSSTKGYYATGWAGVGLLGRLFHSKEQIMFETFHDFCQ